MREGLFPHPVSVPLPRIHPSHESTVSRHRYHNYDPIVPPIPAPALITVTHPERHYGDGADSEITALRPSRGGMCVTSVTIEMVSTTAARMKVSWGWTETCGSAEGWVDGHRSLRIHRKDRGKETTARISYQQLQSLRCQQTRYLAPCISTNLPGNVSVDLLVPIHQTTIYLLTNLSTCNRSAYLSTDLQSTYLPIYQPTTILPTYPPIYNLPTYQSINLQPFCLPLKLHIC